MRIPTALALLSALTGCASTPRGPHAEFRDGIAPVAPPAPVAASYLLHSAGTRVAVQCAEKGEPVGFARNPDGSVSAVAPDFNRPLTPGSYAWVVIREPVTSEPSLVRRSLRTVGDRLGSLALILLVVGGAAAYAVAAGNSHR